MNDAAHKRHSALFGTGVAGARAIHVNDTATALTEHFVRRGEGKLSEDGAMVVETGVHTGRSVKDKFVVDEPGVREHVWWAGNGRLAPEKFEILKGRVQAYLQGQELFVQDLYAGADPDTASGCAWLRRERGRRCSRATCSSVRGARSWRISNPTT